MQRNFVNWVCLWVLCGTFFGTLPFSALAEEIDVHGLWVWRTVSILEMPRGAETLREFCRSQNINEVYVAFSGDRGTTTASGGAPEDNRVADLIAMLHQSNLRVEALLSSADADEPGRHREKLLDDVRAAVQFNQNHPRGRFDGIHLDIEPQQRAENKGAGNLQFLPALVETYRAARALAGSAQMTVNADISNKFLKGDLGQREMLLSALPRLTLMLYELSSPGDGETTKAKIEKLRKESQNYLDMAYQGLGNENLAKMGIALRTPDYGALLPVMFQSLDDALRTDRRYLGWAWHSYNDNVKPEH